MFSTPTTKTPAKQSARIPSPWPTILLTILVGIFAAFLALPQIFPGEQGKINLPTLNKGVPVLRETTNTIQRDSLDFLLNGGADITDPRVASYVQRPIGLAALCRAYDQILPKDAEIFLSGMVGKENTSRGGYYFFLRNYLFPRSLRISLGQPAIYRSDDEVWWDGVDCESPEILKTNGFDLFLRFGSDNSITPIPLTQRGVPKQQ